MLLLQLYNQLNVWFTNFPVYVLFVVCVMRKFDPDPGHIFRAGKQLLREKFQPWLYKSRCFLQFFVIKMELIL